MNEPKPLIFSVVITTYNRAHLIIETLETVFLQTYPHYEILVVDDCSSDNTELILEQYILAKKIRYIRNEKNYERAYSRNIGLMNATGDYATLLDSDDFLYPDCLANAYDFIIANPDIKVFQTKFELVNDCRQRIYKFPFPSLKNQYKALCSGNFMCMIGGFIHREVYQQARFDEDPKMILSEDYEFWFKIFAKYKVGRINKVNTGIRAHPNRSVNVESYKRLDYQCNKMVTNIKNDPLLNEKFGKYTGRLKASFKLMDIISNSKSYTLGHKMKLLLTAVKHDLSLIQTRRFMATAFNIFR